MAREYLDKLSAFIEKIASESSVNTTLECKHFFSGAAVYAEQRICITLTPVGLAIKLPRNIRDRLFQSKVAVPLRYFPAGPIKKEYALFTDGIVDADEALFNYVKRGIDYALSHSEPVSKNSPLKS
jgi:hypothetical protein